MSGCTGVRVENPKLYLQGLAEEEKARDTRRLIDAAERLKKNSSKPIRCGLPQDQAQGAAMHMGRKKRKGKDDSGDATCPAADLGTHSLWSRKYQPSSLSEVSSELRAES